MIAFAVGSRKANHRWFAAARRAHPSKERALNVESASAPTALPRRLGPHRRQDEGGAGPGRLVPTPDQPRAPRRFNPLRKATRALPRRRARHSPASATPTPPAGSAADLPRDRDDHAAAASASTAKSPSCAAASSRGDHAPQHTIFPDLAPGRVNPPDAFAAVANASAQLNAA